MAAVGQSILILFGALIVLVCVWGAAFPAQMMEAIRNVWMRPGGMALAIGLRVVLGLTCIAMAPLLRFPSLFYIVGALALIGAAVVPFMGHDRIEQMIEWFADTSTSTLRLMLACGFGFGALLIYGAV